jgi:hypothetical protein
MADTWPRDTSRDAKVAISLEQMLHEHSKRPRCVKCGKPDIIWFEGDPCKHEKRMEP